VEKGTPGSLFIISGPPGTGKTDLILYIIAPFIVEFHDKTAVYLRRRYIIDTYKANSKSDETFEPWVDKVTLVATKGTIKVIV